MLTSLYLDRATVIHRLHPIVKLAALFVLFWSAFWVDQPLALLPIAILMGLLAHIAGAWPNFRAFRWFILLLIIKTMIQWVVIYP